MSVVLGTKAFQGFQVQSALRAVCFVKDSEGTASRQHIKLLCPDHVLFVDNEPFTRYS
jgi:hypothetical protein